MKNTVAVLIVGGFLASLGVVVAAQATRSVNEGVYTADQAKKGEATYKEQCAACHGDNLEGSGPMPLCRRLESNAVFVYFHLILVVALGICWGADGCPYPRHHQGGLRQHSSFEPCRSFLPGDPFRP